MSKLAVLGSTNIVKLKAVEEVLSPYGYVAKGENVDSLVGSQPKTDEETIRGAINRAKALTSGDLRLGLEAGVQLMNGTLFLINYGALISETGKVYLAGGTRIPLPDVIKDKIFEEDLELADAMDSYFKTNDIKHHEGAVGYFTSNLVKRVDIFTHIVRLLYGQYLKEEEK